MVGKSEVYKDMDESSNKDKEYAEYSEERNTLTKILMKLNFQINVIIFILTSILYLKK